MVFDRKAVKKRSFFAKLLKFIDKSACSLADIVLLDTNEHIKYFCSEFELDKGKFRRVWIGADDSIFYPRQVNKNKKFTVIFHGKFIPLQGVEYIIKAAKLLEGKGSEGIEFKIIGEGYNYSSMLDLASNLNVQNIEFLGYANYNRLPALLSKAHIGLGIFGSSDKARRVIPNKAYEILALGLPLLTGDSAAIRELLEDKKDCVLCKIADEHSLAQSVLLLMKDSKLRKKIANGGYRTFKKNCSVEVIGKITKKILLELCRKT